MNARTLLMFSQSLTLLIFLIVGFSPAATAEIYKYTDKKGQIHFSDRPFSRYGPGVKNTASSLSASIQDIPTLKIYKYVDHKGVVHLTDRPPNSRYQLIYSGKAPSGSASGVFGRNGARERFANLVDIAASHTGLDSALLHAVITVESAYNPDAVSPKGAVGLMQLMPGTAKRYGVSDSTDPYSNIDGGARYLKDLLDMFNHNVNLALAAYNAGENAVIRYGNKIPPYTETKSYVSKVMKLYQAYRLGKP